MRTTGVPAICLVKFVNCTIAPVDVAGAAFPGDRADERLQELPTCGSSSLLGVLAIA